jgi:glycosyltransferase involved in cell wall biosynthesis
MTWIGGMANVDVLPNGVDGQFFQPTNTAVESATAVFWGRLDFGPNIQALEWFVSRVWPAVRQRTPDARLTIVGFQPGPAVLRLAKEPGIRLEPNIEDLRPVVTRHAIAVLPFVSGAGIKNKLLEAASLGMPIVCTPTAARGLKGQPPLSCATTPKEWSDAMVQLWSDAERSRALGAAARQWVLNHHTWESVAREAASRLEAMLPAR